MSRDDRLLLDYDKFTGRSTYFNYKHHNKGEEIELITEYDANYAKGVMDVNKDRRNMGRAYYAKDDEMWHVGTIPAEVQLEWLTKFGVDMMNQDHMPEVIKLVNSQDYCHLKTANIRL